MAKYNNKKVLQFPRRFDLLDPEDYVSYEFAWPVEVVECQANRMIDDSLDALEQATLELFAIPDMTLKKAASLLEIGEEVINAVVKNLARERLFDSNNNRLTEQGKSYIETKEKDDFIQEKVFGNMFVSRVDGEVFPFFYEGKLPWQREYPDLLYLSYDEESDSVVSGSRMNLVDRVNRAYHKYGIIAKTSRENTEKRRGKEIEFIEEELIEESYSQIEKEPETLADVEMKKLLKNARIKVLKTKPKEAYIRCRVSVSKAAPKQFIVDSPFSGNITSWYSECFHRMTKNNESIYLEDGEETLLENFCSDVTQKFYIDFPELQANDFNQFIKINYPEMLTSVIKQICLEKYRKIFNYNLLASEGKMSKDTIIIEEAKAIEMILNNYVMRTDKNKVISKYENTMTTIQDVQDMLDDFGIKSCGGLAIEKKYATDNRGNIIKGKSLMGHFYKKYGHSIAEKYFFLVADAYFFEKSVSRKLLVDQGYDFIKKLDFIGQKRNSIGGHEDGITISDSDYETYQKYFKEITKILLMYLN